MWESKHQFFVTMIFKKLKWVLYLIHFVIVMAIALIMVYSFMYGADETIKLLKIKN